MMKEPYKLIGLLLASSVSMAQSPIDFNKMDTHRIDSDPSVEWTQFGPGGSGNNYHIYWHPTDPEVVFQGPNMGNSYRSADRGETYEGILDPDGPGYKSRDRGPVEIYAPEFSRQDPDFGICTIEDAPVIYVTHDRGRTWKRSREISQQFGEQHVNTIAVDPTDDSIWYAGSGNVRDCNHYFFTHARPHGIYGSQRVVGTPEGVEQSDYNHVAKIWKSTDRGQTWKEITPKGIHPEAQITRILVHPGRTETIFAPTTYGFYKSTDSGVTWSHKTGSGMDNDIIRSMDMHYDPAAEKVTLFAIDLVKYIPAGSSIRYNGGIFKSTDEGESWTNINNNMPLGKSLLESYLIRKTYYKTALAKWFNMTEKDVTERYPELPEKMLHSVSIVRVNPRDVNKLIVVNNYKSQFTFAGGMLWRSDNGGSDWFVTLRNGFMWEGDDMELWKARNNPTSHNVSWVGQKEWEKRDAYDRKSGAIVEFNCDGTTIMYQLAKIVCVSEDNGDSWYENDDKETAPGSGSWVGAGNSNMPGTQIVQEMRIPDSVFFCSGENTIWRTTDDGGSVRPDAQAVYKLSMPGKDDPEECSVDSMAFHPEDVNTMYSLQFRQAYFGKLMRSTDGGANWHPVGTLFNPEDYGNPVNMHIRQRHLTIDPDNPDHLYCVVSKKFVDDITGVPPNKFKAFGVYRSMDGGRNWEVFNRGLPEGNDVQKIGMGPSGQVGLYAAVRGSTSNPGGLYVLRDGERKWARVNIPEGMVSIHDFTFSSDGRLYVSGGALDGSNSLGGVWFTENGRDWKQVFPYRYSNHIRVARYDPNVLLVSVPSSNSDILNPGIYRSLDKGITWHKINTGNIQSDRLNDLAIDYWQEGVYWCSTYGAGYYKAVDLSRYRVLDRDAGN